MHGCWLQVASAGKGEPCTNVHEGEEARSILSIVSASWRPHPEEIGKRAICIMLFLPTKPLILSSCGKKTIRELERVGRRMTLFNLRFNALDKVIMTVHLVTIRGRPILHLTESLGLNTSTRIYGHCGRMHGRDHFDPGR